MIKNHTDREKTKDWGWLKKRGVRHGTLNAALSRVSVRKCACGRKVDCKGGEEERNTRQRRGRHAHVERRDATSILVMLLFSVAAQIAHDEIEGV